MKLLSLFIYLLFFLSVKSQPRSNNANELLQKVSKNLASSNTISYELNRELYYPSQSYHVVSKWQEHLEFINNDSINFIYQIEDETEKQIFNGSEIFDLNIKTKSIRINNYPAYQLLQSTAPLYNSILTLRNIIPLLLKDNTISKTHGDTIYDDKSCHLITVTTGTRRINNLGDGFTPGTDMDYIYVYKIVINKTDNMPLAIIQPAGKPEVGFIKTEFLHIQQGVEKKPELSWYYSTYTTEYKVESQKSMKQLISAGSFAPDWTLSLYNKNEKISLSNLKGKIVFLDLWIKNCGPCIKSVPHLNSLKEKYKNEMFEILAINLYDSQKDISWFCDKYNINYTVLMNGKSVAEKYGVNAFPTCILIDKNGKVLYSGGFDNEKIEELIKKAL